MIISIDNSFFDREIESIYISKDNQIVILIKSVENFGSALIQFSPDEFSEFSTKIIYHKLLQDKT